MAPEVSVPSFVPLRLVTQRLASTPVAQLPRIVPFLAATISTHGSMLREVNLQSQKKHSSESIVVVHKLKTQLTTLLQNESKEARWAAIVLIKAMVEVGGVGFLQNSGNWVRSLLGLLGVSD